MSTDRCATCDGYHYGLSCDGKPLDIVHARAMVYVGRAYSPWAGCGGRLYQERKLPSGDVELVCGRGLRAEYDAGRLFATLKSKSSREARSVTCPDCLARIRQAGFKCVAPEAAE